MAVDDRGVSIITLAVGAIGGCFAAIFGLWLGAEDGFDAPVLGWPFFLGGGLVAFVCVPALAIRLGISRPSS